MRSLPQRAPFDGERSKLLTIVLRDPASGRDSWFHCVTTSDRIPAQDTTIETETLAEVAAALCEAA